MNLFQTETIGESRVFLKSKTRIDLDLPQVVLSQEEKETEREEKETEREALGGAREACDRASTGYSECAKDFEKV